MSKIQINIFDVDVPNMGGLYRIIYLLNSPIEDYSFHSFENHEKELEKFISNLQYILDYDAFKGSKFIEVSFNKMMKMHVGGQQKDFIDLDKNMQKAVCDILEKYFPNYKISVH